MATTGTTRSGCPTVARILSVFHLDHVGVVENAEAVKLIKAG